MARQPEAVAELHREVGATLTAYLDASPLTQGDLARLTNYHRTSISHIQAGRQFPERDFWEKADKALDAGGALVAHYDKVRDQEQQLKKAELAHELAVRQARAQHPPGRTGTTIPSYNDEIAAIELDRCINASDIGHETLALLESAVDNLSCKYPLTPPAILLDDLRQYLSFVTVLMDKRMKLSERRRLVVAAGWLSLLAATVHIDLKQESAARTRLLVALNLAQHAEHNEIRAWCYETEAWRVLTDGDYARALKCSRVAQALAPAGSSIAIQSIAQEGRALARMGRMTEMHAAIDRVHKLVSPLGKPDQPEHHYKYDPDKSVAYTATTLAWGRDPAGEEYAREVIARLTPAEEVGKWPRRLASANLDLALILVASDRIDEACGAAKNAILSGRIVPSNQWRASEVVNSVTKYSGKDVQELLVAYRDSFQDPAT